MNCDNCYYKKLCERGGVGFKDDGNGECIRAQYLNPKCLSEKERKERDECLSSFSKARGGSIAHDARLGIGVAPYARYPYDASNVHDRDAQERPRPNIAPFNRAEEERKRINDLIDAQVKKEKKGKRK